MTQLVESAENELVHVLKLVKTAMENATPPQRIALKGVWPYLVDAQMYMHNAVLTIQETERKAQKEG